MLSPIEAQFMSLIISVFAGLIIGLLFDFYRTINYYTRPTKTFLLFMDLLFWLVTVGITFSILLRADFAELRLFTFVGVSIGVLIYFKLFTLYILKLYRLVIYIIIKVIRVLFVFIILPFKLLYNLMWIPANFTAKLTKNTGKRISLWIHAHISKGIKKK